MSARSHAIAGGFGIEGKLHLHGLNISMIP